MNLPRFLSEELKLDPPSASWSSFRSPRLRQYPHHQEKIHFIKFLGRGEDREVFKLYFGDGKEPVAMKVRPPKNEHGATLTWALEGESHNAVIFENIKAAVEQSANPICLRSVINEKGKRLERREAAIRNLWALSTEGREHEKNRTTEPKPEKTPVSIPEMTNCQGWMKISHHQLSKMRRYSPPLNRVVSQADYYYAIIYDFIPRSELEFDVIQEQLDFFQLIGFQVTSFKLDNWEGRGLLVDFSDLSSPLAWYWSGGYYKYSAEAILWQLDGHLPELPPLTTEADETDNESDEPAPSPAPTASGHIQRVGDAKVATNE